MTSAPLKEEILLILKAPQAFIRRSGRERFCHHATPLLLAHVFVSTKYQLKRTCFNSRISPIFGNVRDGSMPRVHPQ